MLGITLKISGRKTHDQTICLVDELIGMTCSVLNKEASQTMLIIQFVPHEQWLIGRRFRDDAYGYGGVAQEYRHQREIYAEVKAIAEQKVQS